MKLSMMSYTLARQGWKKNNVFDLKGMCDLCRELNLDGVDMITTYGIDPQEIRRIFDDYGLKTICYTFFADLIFADAHGRKAGVDQIKQGLDMALALGTDKVMIPMGGKDPTPRDLCRRYTIRGLQEAAVLARHAGITLTV